MSCNDNQKETKSITLSKIISNKEVKELEELYKKQEAEDFKVTSNTEDKEVPDFDKPKFVSRETACDSIDKLTEVLRSKMEQDKKFQIEILNILKEQNNFTYRAHFAIELAFLFVLIALVIIAI